METLLESEMILIITSFKVPKKDTLKTFKFQLVDEKNQEKH
jgi:hypothetical protein